MKILLGRDHNETLRQRSSADGYAQRLFWLAEDGDIVVLPGVADDTYLKYVTRLTGTLPETLSIVVMPAANKTITDRLGDPQLAAAVRGAIGGRRVDRVISLWPDASSASFAEAVGAAEAFGGHDFFTQGGDLIANSKAVFRMLAAGSGVPIAPGAVCVDIDEAERALRKILDRRAPAIIKHEFYSGGWGNEVLTLGEPVTLLGAHRMTTLTSGATIRAYLEERWPALTGNGRHRLIVEQYIPDSKTVFAEYMINDDGFTLGALGGLVPTLSDAPAQVLPVQGLSDEARTALRSGAESLCVALHQVGYRGVLSADAIVTPDRRVIFTEFNGRYTGSTHTYDGIGRRVVGDAYGRDRFILERAGGDSWGVGSFDAAVSTLNAAGLAYSPEDRSGVIFVLPRNPELDAVQYCIVAGSMDDAMKIEGRMSEVFRFTAPITVTTSS